MTCRPTQLVDVTPEDIRIATANSIEELQKARKDMAAVPNIDKEVGAMQSFDPTSLIVQAVLTILRQWFTTLDQERASTPLILNKMSQILMASAQWHKDTALKIADIQTRKRAMEFDRIKNRYMAQKPMLQHQPGSLDVTQCKAGCCNNGS
jgi:hypothetical protein